MDYSLALHVENNQDVWFKYVNDREFIDKAINTANQLEEEKDREKRKI